MNKNELNAALKIAKSKENLLNVDISIFDGFGLSDFCPVNVTIRQVARLIRYQCIMLNGELDAKNFNELCYFARKRFSVFGH